MDPSTMKYRIILLLSAMLLQSFCFLPASVQGQPQTTFDFKIGNTSTLSWSDGSTDPTEYMPFQLTSYLVSGNVNYLNMVTKYTGEQVHHLSSSVCLIHVCFNLQFCKQGEHSTRIYPSNIQ